MHISVGKNHIKSKWNQRSPFYSPIWKQHFQLTWRGNEHSFAVYNFFTILTQLIDADNADARKFDPRLRGPVQQIELDIDIQTGMKNYIANENGGWATSAGYVKFSFSRSIHFGRLYTNGSGSSRGKEADLCEALR